MDHHKGAGAEASVDGFEDQYYSGRRPNSMYVPRFRNLKEKRNDYLRGFGYLGGASRGGWDDDIIDKPLGNELKKSVQQPGGWHIGFGGFGECLPYHENRVMLNRDGKDKWGRPTLKMDCEFKQNEKVMQKDIADAMA